ncbi:acyl-CoA dehydrogenase family protein [Marininema halotolerans]|uniref:Acyl-CoA dehydrogenase n=1 Tax=Marininema halotolerans TaxID=1155944 RepID=A0A1I6PWQ9_9BACL|nr:acyl-CoA dehydrogenase family protein [Marininema halotolerans]SFS44520.1 Acyl-CoA dehydrogenase [Marininema halotolerans]
MKTLTDVLSQVEQYAAAELRPRAGRFEAQEAIPREVLQGLAKHGIFGATLPTIYGGLALDPIQYGQLTEMVGKACNSVRELLTVHVSLVGESILRWGTGEQKQYWLPKMATGEVLAAFALTEPEVGSDANGIDSSYRQEGDHFILNGRKKWISFGDLADLYLVLASRGDEMTAFLVDSTMTGVSTTKMSNLLASNASHLAEIHFQDVEVPLGNVLGRVGGGFAYVVNSALDHGRYSIAWAGVAIAQEALDGMVTYGRTRRQGGRVIGAYAEVQQMIAEASVNIHASRALCIAAGQKRRDKHPDAVIETTMAKYFTSKMAMKVATDAVQVFGGNGFSREYPVERLFREAKALEIIEGTSQVLQPVIAQHALRTCYQQGWWRA